MKRSEINRLVREATTAFERAGWTLPPNPRWDVTDFGLGDASSFGLVLVNLADEPEYCEKLMYAKRGMVTPPHAHRIKKEDIVARAGALRVRIWGDETLSDTGEVEAKRNGETFHVRSGQDAILAAGERITLLPGVYHEFEPVDAEAVIGEVSTANDDANDNLFVRADVGRYAEIEEDEPPLVGLVSDR